MNRLNNILSGPLNPVVIFIYAPAAGILIPNTIVFFLPSFDVGFVWRCRFAMERGSISDSLAGSSYFMVQLPDGSMEKRLKMPINIDPGVHSSFNLDQLIVGEDIKKKNEIDRQPVERNPLAGCIYPKRTNNLPFWTFINSECCFYFLN